MRTTIGGVGFAVLLSWSSAAWGTTEALAPTAVRDTSIVGSSVYEKLRGAGRVRVMIFLELPAAANGGAEVSETAVAKAQDDVLSALSGDRFILARRFRTVPALAGEITAAGIDRLVKLPGIIRVDVDEGGSVNLAQAIPLMNVDDVQTLGYTGEGVTVAVLDSGLDTDHPDLADDLDGQACFCSGGPCCPNLQATQFGPGAAEDDNGHGSNVSGIVTSGGLVAHAGMAPDAKLVGIKVIDANGAFCCSSDVVAGLDWIIANRPDVDIVNMSLGTSAMFSGNCDNATSFTMAFATAINTLRTRGVTTFVSSGNNGSGTQMQAPACVANALSVGAVWDANVGSVTILGCTDATTAANKVTCFTNSNSTTDLFAPGAPTRSDWLFGGLSTYYGTSQASPAAAGCAADLLEAYPMLTPSQLESALESTGLPVTDVTNGLSFPRVDCLAAFNSLVCHDVDGDGYGAPGIFTCPSGSQTDCDDGNGQVNAVPGEATGLLLSRAGATTSLEWSPPSTGATPTAMLYDTLRSSSPTDFSGAASCVESDDGPNTLATDLATPPPGQAFFFLVRAQDSCGAGSLGTASGGAPRTGRSCP